MMPLPSGRNVGQPTALPAPASVTRSRTFENVDLPSKSITDSTRWQVSRQAPVQVLSVHIAPSLSLLTKATWAPSGENAGVVPYVTIWLSDGDGTTMPVVVSSSLDAVPGVENTPCGRNGQLRCGGNPLSTPTAPPPLTPSSSRS